MYHSLVFVSVFVLSVVSGSLAATDPEAQARCKSIHHTDVDVPDTMYHNSKCLLNCNIHGRIWSHFENEGLVCSLAEGSGLCESGTCVHHSVVVPTNNPPVNSGHLGHIDVEMESASLAMPANAYAMVCVQNFTEALSLPLHDRSKCTSCTTSIQPSSTFPVWNSVCSGSGTTLFAEQSRVTFEVFDNYASGNQVFLGGASLTIPQLLTHGDNHKRLHLALTGGHVAAQINARVTWTPPVSH